MLTVFVNQWPSITTYRQTFGNSKHDDQRRQTFNQCKIIFHIIISQFFYNYKIQTKLALNRSRCDSSSNMFSMTKSSRTNQSVGSCDNSICFVLCTMKTMPDKLICFCLKTKPLAIESNVSDSQIFPINFFAIYIATFSMRLWSKTKTNHIFF